jgi:tellurite resistance protein TehA-like permease
VITGGGVAAWVLATCLVPVLAAFSGARMARPPRLRYSTGGWVLVFPLGMYATAGLTLGTVGGLPLLHRVGAVAVWPAVAAWAVTAFAMGAAVLTRRDGAAGLCAGAPDRRHGGQTEPGATVPFPASCGGETAQVTR